MSAEMASGTPLPGMNGHMPSSVDAAFDPVRSRAILAVLSLASFMASLDLFIVNVAFDQIGNAFPGTTLSSASWVLNAYAIGYAALLVPLGRLADRYGRKGGFLVGLGLFTVASAACAMSPTLSSLVAFRAIKAAGAALLTPTSLALLLESTAPAERSRAVRIWAVTGSLAAAAGPVLGGLLVVWSWRWVFLVNVPVGLAALALAMVLVPRSREPSTGAMPDLFGAGLLALSIGGLAYALVSAPDHGWTSVRVLAALTAAVLLGLSFAARSRRHPSPVVEPELLRVPSFAWANIATLLFNVAFAASLLAVILFMQLGWKLSGTRTGFSIAPGPLAVPIFAAIAQAASSRGVPAGRLAAMGCLLVAGGAALLYVSVGAEPAYSTEVLPAWVVTGAGVGLAMPTILSAGTIDLPRHRSATGSAIVSMSRQIGAVLGVGILVAILGSPHGFDALRTAFRHLWLAIIGMSLLAALAASRLAKAPVRKS